MSRQRGRHSPSRRAARQKTSADPSLTEVLTSLGFTHEPTGSTVNSDHAVRDDTGKIVFTGSALGCWEWLRDSNLYPLPNTE